MIWVGKPGRTQTRLYSQSRWLEAGYLGFRKKKNFTIPVAKTKALISFAVTAKLICAFVFAYVDCWFSHAVAHLFVLGFNVPLNNFLKSCRDGTDSMYLLAFLDFILPVLLRTSPYPVHIISH